MTSNNDDDSFIILETSPGSSMDIKCNGIENGCLSLDKDQMDEALKDLSLDTNMALKAHFKIGDCPSATSMMVASTIITEDKSTEELQTRFGELLDENVILRDTLKQNNESMKEQFLLIASCQEDMMRTHVMHKEKFEETKDLVERLRQENKKLKLDVSRLAEAETQSGADGATEAPKSGPSSALEFVTSPDDDTINKLTAQLELVEKQRRQVIVDNEKLTWQKESLEHIVDATSRERDDLKAKLENVELHLSTRDSEHATEVNKLNYTIQELNTKLRAASSKSSVPSEELIKRDAVIQQLESKVLILQGELKAAQLRVLEMENVKLEFTRHRSGVSEAIKIYKDQIQELHGRLKEASTTVFQPVRFSISSETEAASSEFSGLTSNVKLYDRALKHFAELVNSITNGLSDSLVETLGLVSSLHDYKLERATADQFRSGLAEIKQQLEKQHSAALNNIGQVRGTLSIFEGIFKDYNELLKKALTKQKLERPSSAANVEALTSALVARGQELQQMEGELRKMKEEKDDKEVLRAQMDLYRSDFEAEREARQKMASEKENILTDLRTTQRRNQELTQQLDELRKINPAAHRTVTSGVRTSKPSTPTRTPASRPASSQSNTTTGNMVRKTKKTEEAKPDDKEVSQEGAAAKETTPPPPRYDCPVCDKPFKTLILLQQHVESCLP